MQMEVYEVPYNSAVDEPVDSFIVLVARDLQHAKDILACLPTIYWEEEFEITQEEVAEMQQKIEFRSFPSWAALRDHYAQFHQPFGVNLNLK